MVGVGVWGCALKNSLRVIQGGRDEIAWGLYKYMDNVMMLSSLMKAQHEVMRANNMACIWYGLVSHSA